MWKYALLALGIIIYINNEKTNTLDSSRNQKLYQEAPIQEHSNLTIQCPSSSQPDQVKRDEFNAKMQIFKTECSSVVSSLASQYSFEEDLTSNVLSLLSTNSDISKVA